MDKTALSTAEREQSDEPDGFQRQGRRREAELEKAGSAASVGPVMQL